jgi:putative aminopeptidase FrvX
MNLSLLKTMCAIHSPSGNEVAMKDFLLAYIKSEQKNWKHKPKVIQGKGFQDNIMLVFGKPRTAIFAHTDSIGFTVRSNKISIQLLFCLILLSKAQIFSDMLDAVCGDDSSKLFRF